MERWKWDNYTPLVPGSSWAAESPPDRRDIIISPETTAQLERILSDKYKTDKMNDIFTSQNTGQTRPGRDASSGLT